MLAVGSIHADTVPTLQYIIQVEDSDVFERDGFDIHSDVAISFTQAILGGEIRIPGISGPIVLKVNSHLFARLFIFLVLQFYFSDSFGSTVTSQNQTSE